MSELPPKKHRAEGSAIAASDTPQDLSKGPFSVLYNAQRSDDKVAVACRFGGVMVGKVLAFDKHFNMVLQDVMEISVGQGAVQRDLGSIFLRGDGVIYVLRMPK
jgi:small nuclear ribonucleoprotein D2